MTAGMAMPSRRAGMFVAADNDPREGGSAATGERVTLVEPCAARAPRWN
jgi:hypothetical protein